MHGLFDMAAHYNCDMVGPPCITNEMLAHKCPNWLHGELARRASQQVEGLDVKALHMAMMVHCTGRFHQYSSNEFLDNCEQAIKQAMKISDLDETGLSSAMQAIASATKAIPTLSAGLDSTARPGPPPLLVPCLVLHRRALFSLRCTLLVMLRVSRARGRGVVKPVTLGSLGVSTSEWRFGEKQINFNICVHKSQCK